MKLRNRIQILSLTVATLALVFAYMPARAQIINGRLDVAVKAEDGSKLPGVSIAVSNEFFGRTLVTDAAGMARFISLPPGTYKARASLDGFNSVEQGNINIKSGETETICLTLSLAEVTEEVIVTAESPVQDITDTVAGAILDAKTLLEFLPTQRKFTDTVFLITSPLPEINHPMAIMAPSDDPAKIMWGGSGPPPDLFSVGAPCYFHGLQISGFRNAINVNQSGAGTTIDMVHLINNDDDGIIINLTGLSQSDRYSAGIFNSKLSGNGGNGATIIGATGITMIQNTEMSDNRGEGARIENSSNGMFGGAEAGQGNTVVKNGDGMSLINSSNWAIEGNYFGTNPKLEMLGNPGAGIGLAGNSSNNKIGGESLRESNVIAHNGHGIIAFNGTSRNLFLFNQIFRNTNLGINLNFPNGVDINDPFDLDGGANGSQNYPVLTSAVASDTDTVIRGTLNSNPNTPYRIQFYLNGENDPSGHGEGQNPLGSINVMTNGSGSSEINARILARLFEASWVTALATNLNTNDTSEFSQAIQLTGGGEADMELQKSGPQQAGCKDEITYTLTVRNVGTASAFGVRVVDNMPRCVEDEVEVTSSQGFSMANIDSFGVVSVLGRIDPGASVTITIKARLTENCLTNLSNIAEVILEGDENPRNDTAIVDTTIKACPQIIDFSVQGKHVFVTGTGFERGDKIEINGQLLNTKFIDDDTLKAKKGKKRILACDSANPDRMNVIKLIRSRAPGAPVLDTAAFATCP